MIDTNRTTQHHEAREAPVVDVSVGVDLVDVGRLVRLAEAPSTLAGVLTSHELAYCRSRRRPAEHIAARFAAKEAVLKAFGTGLAKGIRWTDVEILKERGGRPAVRLHGAAQALAAEHGLLRIDVSLSHTDALAVAQVVAVWGAAGTPERRARQLRARRTDSALTALNALTPRQEDPR
jgi:holo-[acyl-carrier protein] synthase